MEVYNLEKVECPVCLNRWWTNILKQRCLYEKCATQPVIDYVLQRVKDAA